MARRTDLDDFAAKAAVRIAHAVNRRSFLQKSAVATSAGLATALGVSTRAEAAHNYSVKSGCPSNYTPNGCGDTFGCGPSPACHPNYCSGTHCTNGHSILNVCDGYNCWTWTVCCQSCGSGGTACYRWTCCDCTCGNPCGSYCSCGKNPERCICGVREYLGCFY